MGRQVNPVYFPRATEIDGRNEFDSRSGVDVTFTRSSNRISIGGWYDSYVGIKSDTMSLREFFEYVGITEKDCKRAWKEGGKRG